MAPQSKGKYWCFTLNNYNEADETRISNLRAPCVYVIYGREVGENGTPHLQGFVAFSDRLAFNIAKAYIGSNPHLEIAKDINRSISYCKKEGNYIEVGQPPRGPGKRNDIDQFKDDVKSGVLNMATIRETHSEVYAKYTRFCLEYVRDHQPAVPVIEHSFRPWQENLNGILNREPDDRTIIFLVDHVGNSGKTWFCHFYASKHERVQVLLPGKKADMAYALQTDIRVLFVDAPRSKQSEYLQYDFLEEVKNGYIFSTKYESGIKRLGKVHVVVCMNEYPDMSKLSADRYNVIDVS